MKIMKFTAISSLLAFVVINGVMPPFTIAGGLIDMGYGSRGGSMLSASMRSKEPIQPIPISFDDDRAKIELGKKLFFEPRLSKSAGSVVIPVITSQQAAQIICQVLSDINGCLAR